MKLIPSPFVPALSIAALLFIGSAARAQGADDSAPPKLANWSWESTPSHLRIAAALREARRAGPADQPLLLQRILDSGRDALVAQVDILLRGRVPETGPKDAPQILSEKQRELLLSALGRMPRKAARKELEARLARSPGERNTRMGALFAYGVIGEGKDIGQLVTLVPRKPDNAELAIPIEAREALAAAVTTLLHRDPQAWSTLSAALRTVDASAARTLLDGLAAARDPRALGILYETARSNPKLAWKAASLVPLCGSSLSTEIDREFLDWINTEIQGANPDYARTLLTAVGTLDDGNWVPALIERLEDENSGLREEALTALQRISGLSFPAEVQSWRTWYGSEVSWHSTERPRLAEDLASADVPRVVAALRAYSAHRTRRSELASEVVKVLEHPKAEVRCMAVNVLERLGSPAACGALVGLLDDPDAKVAEAAWQALRTISGVELTRDPELLHQMFGGS